MARAELDDMAYRFYTMGSRQDFDVKNSSFHEFYLANPHKISHNFAICQVLLVTWSNCVRVEHFRCYNFSLEYQNNLPSRRVSFDEIMSESKLSIVLPLELIKLYKKWITEFFYLLETKRNRWPGSVIPILNDVLREVRENSETLEQCCEFLENYSGPPFRKSTEKHRVAFAPVPTNLHVHQYTIDNRATREVLSCGTASALPLRFQSGGLTRLSALLGINRSYQDFPFWSKRKILVDLKRYLGQLSHRLDVEWSGTDFSGRTKLCSDLSSRLQEVGCFLFFFVSFPFKEFDSQCYSKAYEQLNEISGNISELDIYADLLVDEEKRRFSKGENASCTISQSLSKQFFSIDRQVRDSLQNQKDTIDVMFISLTTKLAIMDKINDEQNWLEVAYVAHIYLFLLQSKNELYEKSAHDVICLCLDMLLVLADSILEAQLLGLVMEVHKNSMLHLYFHVQIRSDFVLSQTITIAATAILNTVYRGWPIIDGYAGDLLLTVASFLSVYGDEKGMAEDAWEAWRQLEARVAFTLIRAPSAVCRTCIPLVSGERATICVSIPVPHDVYDSLPCELKDRASILVHVAYFNIGVNHEATLGQSFGGTALETAINQEGAERVLSYSNRFSVDQNAREAVMELVNVVASEPSRKNLAIFEWAMTACELLRGQAVICCKSGKDRTGMAVTIEQGRVFRETCGLNAVQLQEVIASLRRDGARRENCRKNVGKAVYSFSPFQMHFLPKTFRPPNGTYAQGVSS
ncbi:unnamed protein product [Angiostrongylus costaricensis]|uniref:Myotubularin phosphatase domain-containing protein n=1 Tax=Angiostrongylus costaricensis TaxID=334426 RepID=A0A158PJ29_ANGCS|nr:unnamed protein product [Angiostrongylus costaricensis]